MTVQCRVGWKVWRSDLSSVGLMSGGIESVANEFPTIRSRSSEVESVGEY